MNLTSIKICAGAIAFLLLIAGYHAWSSHIYKQGMAEVQGKWDKDRLAQSQELAKTTAEYRAKEQSYQDQLLKAEHEKAIAIQTLTVDRDNALRAVSSMSNSLNTARAKLSATSAPACAAIADYANTVTDVFESCTERYRDMAEKAEQHRIDAKALIDAWPK